MLFENVSILLSISLILFIIFQYIANRRPVLFLEVVVTSPDPQQLLRDFPNCDLT